MFGIFKKKPGTSQDDHAGDRIDAFWAWVIANRARIVAEVQARGAGSETPPRAIHEIGDQLGKISPALAYEAGMSDPETLDVVISAEGMRELFPLVIEVTNRVPMVAGLKATAFRQRNPDVSLHVLDQQMTADDVHYVSQVEGDKIGVDLFFNVDLDERSRIMIGFLMLDMTLGEYDVGTALGSIEFREGRAPSGAKPLRSLAQEVDALPARVIH